MKTLKVILDYCLYSHQLTRRPNHSTTDIYLQTIRGLNTFVEHQLREGCKTKTNQYPCKYCGLVFSEKKLLIVHKKACVETSLINGAHECDICGRRYTIFFLLFISSLKNYCNWAFLL